MVPVLATFGVYIAWRQHRLDKARARSADFDRRYVVYSHLLQLFQRIGVGRGPTDDDLFQFDVATGPAAFFFRARVTGYLKEVRSRLVDACGIADQRRDETLATEDERGAALSRERAHRQWFRDQIREMQHVFAEMRVDL